MYPSLEEEEEATWERGGLLREIFGGVLMAVYGACIHHHGYMPFFQSQGLSQERPVALYRQRAKEEDKDILGLSSRRFMEEVCMF